MAAEEKQMRQEHGELRERCAAAELEAEVSFFFVVAHMHAYIHTNTYLHMHTV